MRVAVFGAILAVATAAYAQSTSSSLTGVVSDGSGAVVAGAGIRLVNQSSGVVLSTVTNEAGLYHFVGLIPGEYRVEVEARGFQKLSRSGITIQISQTLQLDLSLRLGSMQETISVTATAPVLEAQSSSVGQLVEREMIAGMPMFNRSSTALIALMPAAAIQDATGDIPIFSVAGGRQRDQQFTLDGGNHTNTVGLAVNQSQTPLPMDAMQEFRIVANSYSAEYGQSQSGVVTLATRSGTNKFHGSVFEYARNEAFDARSFFAASRPKLRQHQFGGSFGGPIRKDRTHFFLSYDRTQQVTGGTSFQTLPTPRQRAGDFSQTLNAQGRMILVYDPATTQGAARQPFPGNTVPDSRIDPVSRKIAANWPEPNLPGSITGANNFSRNTRPTSEKHLLLARADHQFNSSNQLMVRYFFAIPTASNPGVYNRPELDSSSNGNYVHNLLGTWTHTFRPSLLNELRFGFVRRDYFNERGGLNQDWPGQLGLRGVAKTAFPIIGVTGFTGLSGAPFRYSTPLLDYQFQDAISWFHGKHAMKIGFETRWGIFNDDTDTSSSGNFAFGPLMTALPNSSGTGNAFATFLLGEVDSANIIRPDPLRSRASYWGVYIQDDWRISNRLTLNLGLRWEGMRPRTEDNDRMNAFDAAAINPVSKTRGVVTFAGRNGVPRTAYDFDPTNFGPRVGFAWKAFDKTVIRGGSGIIYGSSVNSIVGTSAALGFTTDFRINSSEPGITSAMRLRDGFPSVTRPTIDQIGAGYGAVPVGSSPNTAVTFYERSRPTPISLQYNLNLQHELPRSVLVEVGYLANLSHHLTGSDMSINQVPPSQMGPGNAQVRRPFPQFTNVLAINPPLGNSAYHAGFVKVERRFRGGLSLLAHYTFSKFLDDIESYTEIGDPGSYMNFYNRGLDRGRSGSDIPHRAVLSAVYDLPLLRHHGWLTRAFGGWRTGAIVTFQSGPPLSVYSSVNQTNAYTPGSIRADLVGNPNLPDSERRLSRWFNTDAFRSPAPYTFGTSGRSVLRGPGVSSIDSSFTKKFPIRERWNAEVRAEFFNLLNHANFGLPGHSTGVPAFGIINSAKAGRNTQLSARIEF
jgi:hypothetical protein